MAEYHCTYRMEFPIDEFGRIGGMYSLADLPIAKHEALTRKGIIESKNEQHQYYKVRDVEKNFTEWVPMIDVTIVQDSRKIVGKR